MLGKWFYVIDFWSHITRGHSWQIKSLKWKSTLKPILTYVIPQHLFQSTRVFQKPSFQKAEAIDCQMTDLWNDKSWASLIMDQRLTETMNTAHPHKHIHIYLSSLFFQEPECSYCMEQFILALNNVVLNEPTHWKWLTFRPKMFLFHQEMTARYKQSEICSDL